jgi:hypothetical protein
VGQGQGQGVGQGQGCVEEGVLVDLLDCAAVAGRAPCYSAFMCA